MSSQSWPGRLTSSMYSPLPWMKRGSSLRLTEWPMPPTSGVVVVMTPVVISGLPPGRGRLRRRGGHDRRGLGRAQLARRLLDRLDDVHVARATAEVAADPLADLFLVGVRVLLQKPGGLHDHARRAEPALESVLVPERLLEGVEGGAL